MVAILLCIGFGGTISFASKENLPNSYLTESTLQNISIDYMCITGTSQDQMHLYYNNLREAGISTEDVNFTQNRIKSCLGEIPLTDTDTLIFIQDNYHLLTSGLNAEQKKSIDKYILDLGMQYRSQNPTPRFTYDSSDVITSPDRAEYPVAGSYNDKDEAAILNSERASTVATLRIFAVGSSNEDTSSDPTRLGHSWITVTNISDMDIQIGAFSIDPNCGLTIGVWGNRDEYRGGWYDLEGYFYAQGSYDGRVSLKVDLTQSSLDNLNYTILKNDRYGAGFNCVSFATECWNRVCSTTVSGGIVPLPATLFNNISSKSTAFYNAVIPTDYAVYYSTAHPVKSIEYN